MVVNFFFVFLIPFFLPSLSLCYLLRVCLFLQGKGDGLRVERGGLLDNWDDAEGYYSKYNKKLFLAVLIVLFAC